MSLKSGVFLCVTLTFAEGGTYYVWQAAEVGDGGPTGDQVARG